MWFKKTICLLVIVGLCEIALSEEAANTHGAQRPLTLPFQPIELPSYQEIFELKDSISTQSDSALRRRLEKGPNFGCDFKTNTLSNFREQLRERLVKEEDAFSLKDIDNRFADAKNDLSTEEHLKAVIWGHTGKKQQEALWWLVTIYWDRREFELASYYLARFLEEPVPSTLKYSQIGKLLEVASRTGNSKLCEAGVKSLKDLDKSQAPKQIEAILANADDASYCQKIAYAKKDPLDTLTYYLKTGQWHRFISLLEVVPVETINRKWEGYACLVLGLVNPNQYPIHIEDFYEDSAFTKMLTSLNLKDEAHFKDSIDRIFEETFPGGKFRNLLKEDGESDLPFERMANLGQRAVSHLIAQLNDSDPDVRKDAAQALGKIGGKAHEAVPALMVALKDTSSEVRRNAAEALGKIGEKAQEAVPALMVALKDTSFEVRRNAAEALGMIGEKAVPVLIVALRDTRSDVRASAAEALGEIGEKAHEAVPALIVALKDSNSDVRPYAAWALGRIGEKAQEAVPALIVALKDLDPILRRDAALALGGIGEKAHEAVPALIGVLRDARSDVRSNAAEALGGIGEKAQEAVPALIAKLDDTDPDMQYDAIEALGKIGAHEAVPALIATLKAADPEMRRKAAEALDWIRKKRGGKGRRPIP